MNRQNLEKIRKILEFGWSKETTFPGCKNKWRTKGYTKSYGQCYVTARAVQVVFCGSLLKNKEYNHYWNKLPNGKKLDFTSDQFDKERDKINPGDGVHPVKNMEVTYEKQRIGKESPKTKKRIKIFFKKVISKLMKEKLKMQKIRPA